MNRIEFYNSFLSYTSWLYVKVFQNQFFFFDLWSVVHFGSGVVFFLLVDALFKRNSMAIFLGILIFYELFEILLLYLLIKVILPETFKDQLTDIIVGISGGITSKMYLKLPKSIKVILRAFFISGVFGYLYVGFIYFLPNIINLKNFQIDWSIIPKIYIFGTLNLLFAELYIEKLKKKTAVILLIYLTITCWVFENWISKNGYSFSGLFLYALVLILVDFTINFTVFNLSQKLKWKRL